MSASHQSDYGVSIPVGVSEEDSRTRQESIGHLETPRMLLNYIAFDHISNQPKIRLISPHPHEAGSIGQGHTPFTPALLLETADRIRNDDYNEPQISTRRVGRAYGIE